MGFELAQTRIQARLPRLPDDALWLRLAAQKGLAAYLESARPTALGPWLSGLSSASDAHEVERMIRAHLATIVEEVARWVPQPWAPAVRWTLWLAYLPEVKALIEGRQGTPASAEVRRLPIPPAAPERSLASRALLKGLEGFRSAAAGGRRPIQLWVEAWRALWPACGEGCAAGLDDLVGLLSRHGHEFAALAEHAAWPSRRALVRQVRLCFRRHIGEPAAVFAYLALVALALEKLRGDLIRRSVFPLSEAS